MTETTEEHRRLAAITQQLSGHEVESWITTGEWGDSPVPANCRRALVVAAAAFAAFEHAIMKRVGKCARGYEDYL